jgi:ABC-2 type transport system ATP-binding protein
VIRVRDLVKSYGGADAVCGVSFDVRPGEITGYLGPNGAGKSTTVKLITGVLKPTSGSVEVCGHDVATAALEAKRCIGYVPENQALYTSLTPHEYLSLVAELHGLEREHAAERMRQLTEAFGIAAACDTLMESFSKGMRQKVLLTAALLHDPDVVLFDEPLNGLDVNAALTFRRIVEGLAERGKTVLYCSHILDVVERLCTRVIVIDRGRIVADDRTAALLSGHPSGRLEAVFQDLTRQDGADEWVGNLLEAIDARRERGAAEIAKL